MTADMDVVTEIANTADSSHDSRCYSALFTEIMGDYFPREGQESEQWKRQDAFDAAGDVMALFAGAVADGDHGPGCPERADHDAEVAALRAARLAAEHA